VTGGAIFDDAGLQRLILVGRGPHVAMALAFATEHNIEAHLFTSPRLADDDGVREAARMTNNFRQVTQLGVSDLAPLVGPGSFVLSMGSPFIFTPEMIELFKGRVVNLHGGALPRFRGAATYSWHILMAERDGASTIHLVTPKIDGGDIVSQRSFVFRESCRFPADYMACQWDEDLQHLKDFLPRLRNNEMFDIRAQDEQNETYFPRLDTATHGFADFSWPVDAVTRFIRAFSYPYSGAQSFVHGTEIKLLDAEIISVDEPDFHPFQYGLVLRTGKASLEVAGNGGRIAVLEYQCAHKLRPGDRIHTPRRILEQAMARRVTLCADGEIRIRE
jgi:methionyl-tRNA formyltransferase